VTKPLTLVQSEVLKTLVKLYEEKRRMVKSKDVARALRKDEGTVRNIIMWLKNMGLVESRTGPAGGYVPTLKAYEILGYKTSPPTPGYGVLIVEEKGREVRLTVSQLEILGLFSAEQAKADVRVAGSPIDVNEGDRVRIESTPKKKVVLEGEVIMKDANASEIMIKVDKMAILPDEPVGKIATRKLITIPSTATVSEAASMLYKNGIRGAPITDREGHVIGFITTTDIAMVLATKGDINSPVSKYMRKSVFVINEGESVIEAMKLMDFYGVGRLLVIDNAGKPVGIVTRTDILRFMLAMK